MRGRTYRVDRAAQQWRPLANSGETKLSTDRPKTLSTDPTRSSSGAANINTRCSRIIADESFEIGIAIVQSISECQIGNLQSNTYHIVKIWWKSVQNRRTSTNEELLKKQWRRGKSRRLHTACGTASQRKVRSLREEGSDHPWLYLVQVGERPQRRRRCNVSAGIDARDSAVNGCRCLSVRAWIRSGHTVVTGVTSWRVELGDLGEATSLGSSIWKVGYWLRLSTSVPSIKDCMKVARLLLERQSRRMGLTTTSAKVIDGLRRWRRLRYSLCIAFLWFLKPKVGAFGP